MIRQRSVMEMLDAAFTTVRRFPIFLLWVALVLEGVPALIEELLVSDDEPLSLAATISMILGVVGGTAASYATVLGLMAAARSDEPSLAQALISTMRSFGSIALMSLVLTTAVEIGPAGLFGRGEARHDKRPHDGHVTKCPESQPVQEVHQTLVIDI